MSVEVTISTIRLNQMVSDEEDIGRIHVYMDPWSDEHGTWELNPESLAVQKISEEPDLTGEPYQETDCHS